MVWPQSLPGRICKSAVIGPTMAVCTVTVIVTGELGSNLAEVGDTVKAFLSMFSIRKLTLLPQLDVSVIVN